MTTAPDLNLPTVGDGSGLEPDSRLYVEELQLAFRNHALPLEGLRYELGQLSDHPVSVGVVLPDTVDTAALDRLPRAPGTRIFDLR